MIFVQIATEFYCCRMRVLMTLKRVRKQAEVAFDREFCLYTADRQRYRQKPCPHMSRTHYSAYEHEQVSHFWMSESLKAHCSYFRTNILRKDGKNQNARVPIDGIIYCILFITNNKFLSFCLTLHELRVHKTGVNVFPVLIIKFLALKVDLLVLRC